MLFEYRIRPTGESIATVLERDEGHQCDVIKQLTSALGREVSDEPIGPECDPNFEFNDGLSS